MSRRQFTGTMVTRNELPLHNFCHYSHDIPPKQGTPTLGSFTRQEEETQGNNSHTKISREFGKQDPGQIKRPGQLSIQRIQDDNVADIYWLSDGGLCPMTNSHRYILKNVVVRPCFYCVVKSGVKCPIERCILCSQSFRRVQNLTT